MNYGAVAPDTAPLVRVDWEDIQTTDRWEDDEVHTAEATSVGYLVSETPSEVVLAGAYSWQDGQWGWLKALPRGVVQRIRRSGGLVEISGEAGDVD